MPDQEPEYVFPETAIMRGIKPVAQRGVVVIDQGTLTLLGSEHGNKRQVIAAQSLSEVTARKTRPILSMGSALELKMGEERYTVQLGNGLRRYQGLSGIGRMRRDANELIRLIENWKASAV